MIKHWRNALNRRLEPAWDSFLGDFLRVQDQLLMEAVVAACAVVAYADGRADAAERDRMLGLIKRFPPIKAFNEAEILEYFGELSDDFGIDHDGAEKAALDVVTVVRERPRYPELIVGACCAIATADGDFSPAERGAAARVCIALGLHPADYDLDGPEVATP